MKFIRFCGLVSLVALLSACEPSPKEATALFCDDLKAGSFKELLMYMTPELRDSIRSESVKCPVLAFAQSYYSDETRCEFLKYETRDGKAHTLVSYFWRWTRTPLPNNVVFDLVWRLTDKGWRIENIYASSHWDMLLPEEPGSAKLAPMPYREHESWEKLAQKMETYLETWYR